LALSGCRVRRRTALQAPSDVLCTDLPRAEWTDVVSQMYGRIKVTMEHQGTRIEDFDTSIKVLELQAAKQNLADAIVPADESLIRDLRRGILSCSYRDGARALRSFIRLASLRSVNTVPAIVRSRPVIGRAKWPAPATLAVESREAVRDP
jgi:hypothetical protein